MCHHTVLSLSFFQPFPCVLLFFTHSYFNSLSTYNLHCNSPFYNAPILHWLLPCFLHLALVFLFYFFSFSVSGLSLTPFPSSCQVRLVFSPSSFIAPCPSQPSLSPSKHVPRLACSLASKYYQQSSQRTTYKYQQRTIKEEESIWKEGRQKGLQGTLSYF